MFVPRRRLVIGAAVILLVAGAVVGYLLWPRGGDLERAAGYLPADTQRVVYTDWAGLREEFDVPRDEAGSRKFLRRLQDRDLVVSSLAPSTKALHEAFGLVPSRAEWELLGQAEDGMTVILKYDGGFDQIADHFESAGFTRPDDDAMSGGVWTGGSDVVAAAGLTTYELQNVMFFEDEGLLVGSDRASYLEEVRPVVQGDEDGLDVSDLAGGTEEPLAAIGFVDGYACDALSFVDADGDAQAEAGRLVEEAGGVNPPRGYLVARQPDKRMTVVFDYESEEQAEEDRDARAALAQAEDPGQFVRYPELFDLGDAEVDGHTVVLSGTVHPRHYPLSNLTSGPVLLASC